MITRTQKEEEEVLDRKSLFHLMQIVTQLYRTRSLQVAFSSDRIDIHDTLQSHVEKVRR
jgi:hypothetical protein